MGEVRMCQEIQDQIRSNVVGQIFFSVVEDWRQRFIDRNGLDKKTVISVLSYTPYLPFSTAELLKDNNLFDAGRELYAYSIGTIKMSVISFRHAL